MKKNNTKIIISVFCFILLGLTACTSNQKVIEGKYISTFDSSVYYIFSKDNTYTTNYEWDSTSDCSQGSYTITDGKITLFGNKDKNYELNIGYIYGNYIGSWWNGTLSKSYENATLTSMLGDLSLEYNFNEDKTYEYTVTSDGEVVHTENGTYSINGNEVICINEDNVTTTFFNTDNGVFCVEYTKE